MLPPISRRQMLQRTACGFGALAFHDLLQAAVTPTSPYANGVAPKAKRVIFLFMQGGPSQIDLFDPKSFINVRHGKSIDSPLPKQITQVGTEKFLALGTQAPVRPRGQSGMMISDLLPHLATVADDICLLRGMNADNPQHAGATQQFHTGTFTEVRPSMGSWISYGLGSENQNLPSFVTIHPQGIRTYDNSFLPAAHQGTSLTVPASAQSLPVENLRNVSESDAIQRKRLDLIQRMNRQLKNDVVGDESMEGMIKSMELAFRMQTTTPEIVDLSKESKATLDLYGVGGKDTDKFGRACLLARKLSESGVRFVQVSIGGWDHHGDIRGNLPKLCAQTDQPVAALIKDLKARGMLEDTLVIFATEFGRTAFSQGGFGNPGAGRDHHGRSFTVWLAGGGVKAGYEHGATDEFGYNIAKDPVHLRDLHATILHCLGIDHERFTFKFRGLNVKLTGVEEAHVVKGVLV
jgi:hypothetical protein